jgi:hypothetical protein
VSILGSLDGGFLDLLFLCFSWFNNIFFLALFPTILSPSLDFLAHLLYCSGEAGAPLEQIERFSLQE